VARRGAARRVQGVCVCVWMCRAAACVRVCGTRAGWRVRQRLVGVKTGTRGAETHAHERDSVLGCWQRERTPRSGAAEWAHRRAW
jgi:hypothetical protein